MNEALGWEHLPPAQQQKALAYALKAGGLGEQSDIIKEQIAKAVGQRNAPTQAGYGPWGGLLNGLGGAMSHIASVIEEKKQREELAKLMPQQLAARQGYANELLAPDPPAGPQAGFLERLPGGKTRYTGGY